MKKETLQKLTPDEVATLRLELTAERTIAALLHGIKLRGGSFEEFTIIVLQMIIAVAEYDKLENTLSNLDNFELAECMSESTDGLPYEIGYESKLRGLGIAQNPFKRDKNAHALWEQGWDDAYTAGLDVKKDAPRKKRA
jgi:hypothetical protein